MLETAGAKSDKAGIARDFRIRRAYGPLKTPKALGLDIPDRLLALAKRPEY